MGIYDRDYARAEERRTPLAEYSAVTVLIAVNAALFLLDVVFEKGVFGQRRLYDWMALRSDIWTHPWNAWQFITYGFAHAHDDIRHVGFNMLGLWMFGREVEGQLGRGEFYRVYLLLVVASGLVWAVVQLTPLGGGDAVVGASGAVCGVVAIFILRFPRRIVHLFGVVPMPAWVLGVLFVLADVSGTFDPTSKVAHVAHLGGAVIGLLYDRSGRRLGEFWPSGNRLARLARRRGLRVHREQDEPGDMALDVDRILEKITQHGEASLTAQERQALQEASRRYQRRRQRG
jgi:membrane associated rhomboid family serine protease